MNLRTQLDFFHDATPDVPQLVAAGALFVLNHSGGKDSQLMFARVAKQVPAAQLVCVHAPLGEVEWPGALELARNQAAAAGVAFVLAGISTGQTLLDKVRARYAKRSEVPSWPSGRERWCTSDLKSGPCAREVRRYADTHGFTLIINCLGLRASESASRYKALPWALNTEHTNSKRTWYDWLPIHHLFTGEVFTELAAAGLTPHHAYALGNERLSCCFCIFGCASDLRNAALANPTLYEKYVALEAETGYTMHVNRKALPDITGLSVRQAYRQHAVLYPAIAPVL
jgi:3'-phosphoadenosine 5'-phosphosulfate sulfotransferase (PAPS reductase)/FAD synthetase